MDRPNTTTSPKSVQRYIRFLEQELGERDAQVAALTRDATTADDWRGPFVAYLDGLGEQTPLARVMEAVHFIPHEDGSVDISVQWLPDRQAIEVRDHTGTAGALLFQPQAANEVLIRKGPR